MDQITKAEILWSRNCRLNCTYCGMKNYLPNTPTLEQWKDGFRNLHLLGCKFAAFYGAEPLLEFEKLPEIIGFAENYGIKTTVITSGFVDDLHQKLLMLYNHGLRSITTSYDHVSDDYSSKAKTDKAFEIVNSFRSFGPVDNVAFVMTLTRMNYQYLPDLIRQFTNQGIWTFFDIIHPYRGQPGSKVKRTDLDLLFKEEDIPSFKTIIREVMEMKRSGQFMIHCSYRFLECLAGFADKAQFYRIWNCATWDAFPSWVTIDADGTAMPCDDFYSSHVERIYMWDLYKNWEKFSSLWKKEVESQCPGCIWNTHLDSHLIKVGDHLITDYIHG